VQVRVGQQRFRFSVLKQYGCKCAVCPITHPHLIQAAHIRGKADRGSDDWRNGLPLCATHHAAFDAHLFAIEPGSLAIRFPPNVTPDSIGVTAAHLDLLRSIPHETALLWRFDLATAVSRDPAYGGREGQPETAVESC
jgi:putative restriction endonuclease